MENRKEIKEKMQNLLKEMDQMSESMNKKSEEIVMFEEELGKLEQDKKTFEVYGYEWGEPTEINEEIEKTEEQIEELYKKLEKYADLKIEIDFKQPIEEKEKEEVVEEETKEEADKVVEEETKEKATIEPKEKPIVLGLKDLENARRAELEEEERYSKPKNVQPAEKENVALKEPSKWDKFASKCKSLWANVKKNVKKIGLALGLTAAATVPAQAQIQNKVSEKIEEIEHTGTREIPVNVQDLQIGDTLTVDGDLTYYYTSFGDQPAGYTGNRTTDGKNLDIVIDIKSPVDGRVAPIHISMNPNGNEGKTLDVEKDSDLGWVIPDELQQHAQNRLEEYTYTETVVVEEQQKEEVSNGELRKDTAVDYSKLKETASQKETRASENLARENEVKTEEIDKSKGTLREQLRVENANNEIEKNAMKALQGKAEQDTNRENEDKTK